MNSAPRSFFKALCRAGVLAITAFVAFTASVRLGFAQATYVYTGNHFTTYYSPYTSADSVFAIVQLNAWLTPNQRCVDATALSGFRLIMYDGINLIDSANITAGSGGIQAYVSTDQSGRIQGPWLVQVLTAARGVAITSANLAAPNVCAGNPQAAVYDNTQGVPLNVPCPTCTIFPFTPSQSNSPGVWSLPPPIALATMLINQIQLGTLPDIGNSLLDQLQQIEIDIKTNNGLACADLSNLIGEVKAQTGKKLTIAQANFILTTLQNMQTESGCGG